MEIKLKTNQIKSNQQILKKQLFLENQQIAATQTIQICKRILSFSNLHVDKQIHIRNVKIYQNDHIHQIYVNSNHMNPQKKKQLPHLVFIHGYGGSSMGFIKLFQFLKQHYQMHAPDLLGYGLSSVGGYSEKFTNQQVEDYYIDAIQQWRKNLKLDSFTMLGHSFGGYLAVLYNLKYPGHIKRLILLSPVGTSFKTKQDVEKQIQRRKKTLSVGSKALLWIAQKLYNFHLKPSTVINSCLLGDFFLERITENRMKVKGAQKQAWLNYFKQTSKRQKSSQTGFYKMFQWPLLARRSIQQIIKQESDLFKFPIQFYYGDIDWMQRNGANKLYRTKQNVRFEVLPNTGHQMFFDNPKGVCQKILRQDRIDKYEQNRKIQETYNIKE